MARWAGHSGFIAVKNQCSRRGTALDSNKAFHSQSRGTLYCSDKNCLLNRQFFPTCVKPLTFLITIIATTKIDEHHAG